MAPIKFEEQIKEKFEGRKIQPSGHAWDKISSQIETTNKSKKKGFPWFAIAASIIGLLIASLVFFNADKEAVIQGKPIVNTPQNKTNNDLQNSNIKLLEEFNTTETILVNNEKSTPSKEKKKTIALPKDDALASTENKVTQAKLQQENKVNLAMEVLINEKVNLIVAQIDSLFLKNNAVTNAEIDALLRKAQDEILMQKVLKNSNSVDAMALLNQAESELDLSVRDQLFEALKSGYLKVRTAVADRNK